MMDSFSSFEYFIVISSSLYVRISRKIKRGNLQDIGANVVCDISTNVKDYYKQGYASISYVQY